MTSVVAITFIVIVALLGGLVVACAIINQDPR